MIRRHHSRRSTPENTAFRARGGVIAGARSGERRPHRLALSALAAVMVALAVFGMWSANRTAAKSRSASNATTVAYLFEQARYAVGQEESLERKYRLEPGAGIRARFRLAGQDLVKALRGVRRIAGPADRALAAGRGEPRRGTSRFARSVQTVS